MIKKIEGPTPNGGDYCEFCYYTKDMYECEKEQADYIVIREYTNDGKIINTTISCTTKYVEEQNKNLNEVKK